MPISKNHFHIKIYLELNYNFQTLLEQVKMQGISLRSEFFDLNNSYIKTNHLLKTKQQQILYKNK